MSLFHWNGIKTLFHTCRSGRGREIHLNIIGCTSQVLCDYVGAARRAQQSLCTDSLAYSCVLVPWVFLKVTYQCMSLLCHCQPPFWTSHLIWNELRSREEIWAQLTAYPSYKDSVESDCAKFCCFQRKAVGKLQEQSGTSGRLQAAAGCRLPCQIPLHVSGRGRQKMRTISRTICKAQKRSWPNILP